MSEAFQKMDVAQARRNLARLYDQVTRSKARVEITRGDNQDACVIISKEELDSLERALELLGNAPNVRELHDAVAHLVADAAAL